MYFGQKRKKYDVLWHNCSWRSSAYVLSALRIGWFIALYLSQSLKPKIHIQAEISSSLLWAAELESDALIHINKMLKSSILYKLNNKLLSFCNSELLCLAMFSSFPSQLMGSFCTYPLEVFFCLRNTKIWKCNVIMICMHTYVQWDYNLCTNRPINSSKPRERNFILFVWGSG